jgi:hypothetical protein
MQMLQKKCYNKRLDNCSAQTAGAPSSNAFRVSGGVWEEVSQPFTFF